MNNKKNYAGIDIFRMIAAILIIAIHTSPLSSFSETADFALTRIAARVAVPFFFMTSGFFMIQRYTYNNQKLKEFVKKTALLYSIAIALYIPINIYSGYFKMDNLAPNIIKDLVFDGTLYHLWYLPASIIGAIIAWRLVKKMDYQKALMIAFLLYLIGSCGDSYYNIAVRSHILKNFYGLLFQVSDYTRNGLFFAPIFFIMGGLIADERRKISFSKDLCGFLISFLCMTIEALTLHHLKAQRHDSMYIFLLPGMYYLFHIILRFRGKRKMLLRTASLIVYLIHPLMIVVIRMFAKLTGLTKLLLENSFLTFLLVCLTSLLFGFFAAAFWNRFHSRRNRHYDKTDRAYIEINLNNLEHNAFLLQKAMPPKCQLMAVVKTQAYGHGAFEIATCLNKIGVKSFAVATIDEGISLRTYGIRDEILILGYTNVHRAFELKKYNLTQTLIDFHYANALNKQGIPIKVHIKIDTGMHRLGFDNKDTLKVKTIFSMKYLKVCGIYSHLCCADSLAPDDDAYTKKQIEQFCNLIDNLKNCGIKIPKLHIQSSYGLLNYPELTFDYVRAGIALYGVKSSPADRCSLDLDLRPVLSLKAKVILIRSVSKGSCVGYGRSFTADKDCTIAILPIGYGDGFPRRLSDKHCYVSINHCFAPIIGWICMDSLAIDITNIEHVSVGDIATLIGFEKSEALLAPVIANRAETISNELLCRLGQRLPVVAKY